MEIADLVNESDYHLQEVTEQFLKQVSNDEIRKQFFTETGDVQFFYFDRQKEKLFLVNQILD